MSKEITVGFIGNPNCGKTTLFNAYTGANLKVANWPGVTVERMEGAIQDHDMTIHLVDLPGTYSLTSYTMEEQVSRQFILSDQVDVIIDVVDASSLERSLYLTLQLLELNKPMVLALNMMDIVAKRGMDIDLHRLSEILGVPVIPVTARKKRGIQALMHAACHQQEGQNTQVNHRPQSIHGEQVKRYAMEYDADLERKISLIQERLVRQDPHIINPRWIAIKLLENDQEIQKKYAIDLSDIVDHEEDTKIINQKYDYIQAIIHEVLLGKTSKEELTDKIDAVVTHPLWGMLFFLVVMLAVFGLTFLFGDFLKGYVEDFVDWLILLCTNLFEQMHVSSWLLDLVTNGIIGGVGGIITFLPNIAILFLALAFLEDSGYMARVAYVMNDIMGRLGLSGRAFIPMVLGFGCTVPAIMASRALESKKDRHRVMLVTPFFSCSAKLPVYILFSGMFFGRYATLAAYSMYLIGIIVALFVAWVLHKKDKDSTKNPLLIELPIYKMPSAYTVFIYVWDKVKDFLSKAGTTIFVASIIVWILMHFGLQGYTQDISLSFAALIGNLLVPVMTPAGLGFWQICVALLAGISAKEVVVSSTAVLFGISNINGLSGMQALSLQLSSLGFTALNAYCLMLFCLLYVPCVASLGTIKKESGSILYMFQTMVFQIAVAWIVSFIVFQVGNLIL
ncbi:ferrous iron transport protein B [Faecalicoccus pleomorphus]|uniref:ferrous iron transport protein B n=1 Tax=Faecalicoccus pleomorphus TaxID=1323 RepID=UPI00232DD1AD|nr:ferrous iron transport protein B [Faecalicoccus pleomorphus]MDB7986740.1 ferrous iron transport protein B [Faecalicoccus pleomorphus]MDB7990442.1 ferrous iron transport protein B [Faecalicoccus pleomorphus]